jgi:RNA polymerase sigma-70 factor (ECF subfamily)
MSHTLATAHRAWARELWALCYRMTGLAADADELVQDTFVRALEAKPSEAESLRPWLFSIATRLCIDRLRRRRTQGYRGPWLPSLVPDEELGFEAPASARYEVLESAGLAFLLALEALSPEQRAAIVLGDVFDLPAKEIATHLETSEANVRQLQLRGRRALSGYDAARVPRDATKHREALEGFFSALATGDVDGARRFLADDVQVLSDGGGDYHAAMVPIHGSERAVLFFTRLLELRGAPLEFAVRAVNGSWAVDATFRPGHAKDAPRGVTGVLLDAAGKIGLIYSVVAPAKLPERVGLEVLAHAGETRVR